MIMQIELLPLHVLHRKVGNHNALVKLHFNLYIIILTKSPVNFHNYDIFCTLL